MALPCSSSLLIHLYCSQHNTTKMCINNCIFPSRNCLHSYSGLLVILNKPLAGFRDALLKRSELVTTRQYFTSQPSVTCSFTVDPITLGSIQLIRKSTIIAYAAETSVGRTYDRFPQLSSGVSSQVIGLYIRVRVEMFKNQQHSPQIPLIVTDIQSAPQKIAEFNEIPTEKQLI